MLGVATLGLSAVPNVAVAIPLAFAVGAAGILYITPTTAIVQVEADPAMHGRLLALQAVFMVGTGSIGGLALGWLADAAGARAPVVVGGAVCVAAGAWAALDDPPDRPPGHAARSERATFDGYPGGAVTKSMSRSTAPTRSGSRSA